MSTLQPAFPQQDLTTLLERLDHIEKQSAAVARQNRWLKAVLVGTVTVLLLGAAAATTDISAKTVTAQKFVVTDAKGTTRGIFETDEKAGPALTLFTADRKPAAILRVMDRGDQVPITSLNLLYADGKHAAYAMVVSAVAPSFGIRNTNGKFYFLMGKHGDNPPEFAVFDDDGNRVTTLGGKPSGD